MRHSVLSRGLLLCSLLFLLQACASQIEQSEAESSTKRDADYPLSYLLGGCCPAAFKIASVPERNGVPIDDGIMFSLNSVFFDTDKDTLRSTADPVLNEIAQVITERQPQHISIEGHADSRASTAYNEDLSRRRAESVRRALVQRGIQDGLFSIRAFGETNPIASNATESGRQRNRRVDIILE